MATNDADKNTLIYTPDGLFSVPRLYIARDHQIPLVLTLDQMAVRKDLLFRFTAVNVLSGGAHGEGGALRAENIVVLEGWNSEGRVRKAWFVRISLETPASLGGTMGQKFLWQLPYGTCLKMIAVIKQHELTNNVPANQNSPLVTRLLPTSMDFYYRDWPALQRITELDTPLATELLSVPDRMFIMSVKSVGRTITLPKDNQPPPRAVQMHRHSRFHRPPSSRLNFAKLPDDVVTQILNTAVSELVVSTFSGDWTTLLRLRRVSHLTKKAVEGAAERLLTGILNALRHALTSPCFEDLEAARDMVLNARLTTQRLLADSDKPGFMHLARLRTDKPVGALPPPPPPPGELAKRLARVIARLQEKSDDDDEEVVDDVPVATTAFERRRLKRRRLLELTASWPSPHSG